MLVFESPEFGTIRTLVMPDGQVGFVGKDVAEVLGYQNYLCSDKRVIRLVIYSLLKLNHNGKRTFNFRKS